MTRTGNFVEDNAKSRLISGIPSSSQDHVHFSLTQKKVESTWKSLNFRYLLIFPLIPIYQIYTFV